VIRSGVEEAVHLGSVAVCDAAGRVVAQAGDPRSVTFARSCTKPIQAAVSLALAGESPSTEEVAVMCASHNAEERHVEMVSRLLDRAGMGFQDLQCPPAWPMDPDRAREVPGPRPEFHDCSGKHAGMLLACVRTGLDPGTYPHADHPLQARVLGAVVAAAGMPPAAVGVDGCGVPVHALPLAGLATAYARLARPERIDGLADRARTAVEAMRAHPYLVAGRGRLCTEVMRAVPGVVAKIGAEGLLCALAEEPGLGIAIKVADGASRARGPALVRVLALLGLLSEGQEEALAAVARPTVLGGGRPVGEVVSDLILKPA
jgi:L-asparaginase II